MTVAVGAKNFPPKESSLKDQKVPDTASPWFLDPQMLDREAGREVLSLGIEMTSHL